MREVDRLANILQDTSYLDVSNEEFWWDAAEQLIANGVIVPPCKVGDTIFVIPSKVNCELNILHNMNQNNRVYEQVVDHITIWQSDYMLYTCDGLCAVRSKAYKDTWFLTKEEAEEALAERSKK